MDPDETLRLLREALDGYPDENMYSYDHAVEAFKALDDWLTRGGYLPVEWQRHQPTHEMMRGRPEAMPAENSRAATAFDAMFSDTVDALNKIRVIDVPGETLLVAVVYKNGQVHIDSGQSRAWTAAALRDLADGVERDRS